MERAHGEELQSRRIVSFSLSRSLFLSYVLDFYFYFRLRCLPFLSSSRHASRLLLYCYIYFFAHAPFSCFFFFKFVPFPSSTLSNSVSSFSFFVSLLFLCVCAVFFFRLFHILIFFPSSLPRVYLAAQKFASLPGRRVTPSPALRFNANQSSADKRSHVTRSSASVNRCSTAPAQTAARGAVRPPPKQNLSQRDTDTHLITNANIAVDLKILRPGYVHWQM